VNVEPAWLEWEERVLVTVDQDAFRIQLPRRTLDERLVVDGWFARDYLEGAHEPGHWSEIIGAGDALHAALAALPERLVHPLPVARTDPWAVADRIAWEEEPLPPNGAAGDRALRELIAARRPIRLPAHVVHGDLTGNVLFAGGLVPAIIDFSPYRRPPAYAIGVIVADAVVWHGADLDLLNAEAWRPSFGQCVVRALIFRHLTALVLPARLPTGAAADRYASLRKAAIRLS